MLTYTNATERGPHLVGQSALHRVYYDAFASPDAALVGRLVPDEQRRSNVVRLRFAGAGS